MAARSIGSGTISFGLVSIPIRLYVATHSEQLSFNQLHKECGSRIKQQIFCPTCERVVERSELTKGYQFQKDRYVTFSDDELKALEAEANRSIDIQEFVPLDKVDPVYFENAHFLGPDKGAEKAYRLLSDAMRETGMVAVAQLVRGGKEHLVLIRPFENGLVLHSMYYADEVRRFDDVETGGEQKIRANELDMARRLVEQLSTADFRPEQYKDEYRERLQEVVKKKSEGEEVTVAEPEQPRAQVIDLMEALKASLAKGPRVAARGASAPAARESAGKRRPAAAERRRETQSTKRRAQKK
jgi:DNA end-binding protein Ku